MIAKEESLEQLLSLYTTNSAIWKSPFFFSPTLLLLYIAIIGLYTSYRSPNQPLTRPNIRNRSSKLLFKITFFLSCLISLTFLSDIIITITCMMETSFNPVLGYYSSVSFLIWISNTYYLMKQANKYSMWQVYQCGFYGLVIFGETMIGLLWLTAVIQSGQGPNLSIYDKYLLCMFFIRYALEVSITLFSFIHNFTNRKRNGSQSETTHLISSTRTETYGSTIVTTTTVYSSDNSVSTKLLKTLPFIWPDDNFELQARLIISIFLMLAGVAINVLTPVQVGYVVDHLEGGSGKFAWVAVAAYAGLKFFQGGSGVLKMMQTQTWEPVENHLLTEISTELKEYLNSLTHEERTYMKMDEAQEAIIRGAKCIIQLLSQVSFHIFPLLATMAVSIIILGAAYSSLGGLIVFITMVTYMYLTITITDKQGDRNRSAKNSAMLGLTQNSVISTGILVGSLWFGWQISRNKATPGDFVVFNLYIMQLCTPLRFLGTYYRMTQKSFKDLGKMSMLFTNKETSSNVQKIDKISPSDGHIVFDRVQFGYDGGRDIFKNLTFTVKRDAFVAVVGPSGCGKSTLMRLIFRFYDPLSGHIYVNGHDSKKIEHSTLRQNIGFIPQNMILFNDTVLYNIRHGNINASDEDVFYAAKVAQIHEEILQFPSGYNTKLGERGYKISDSVKQRLAIARAILKNPNLLLLDESTSALGAETEKSIQKALADFSDNCTVFFATRRLSSIVNADVILVMKGGQLVEFGSHEELLEKASQSNTPSLYNDMWQKHLEELKSTCQDNQSDSRLEIAKDKQLNSAKITARNISNGESSNHENTSKNDSCKETSIILKEAPNLDVLKGSTASSFPALTTSTITTYTDFDNFKGPQFSVSAPNKSYLLKVNEDQKANHNEFRNQSNITKKRCSPIKPTRSVLVEPLSSLTSSNFAELIVPTLLESGLNRFDKFITVESSPNAATERATYINENIQESSRFSETTSNSSGSLDLYTGDMNDHMPSSYDKSNADHAYNHNQSTIPTSITLKSSLVTSNTAELILPASSKSNLKKLNILIADKSKTVLLLDESEYSNTSISHIPETSIVNNKQESSIKADSINKTKGNKSDIFTNNSQDSSLPIHITLPKLVEPVSSRRSSKPSEIIIPGFLGSNLKRLNVKTHKSTVINRESSFRGDTPCECSTSGEEILASTQKDRCVTNNQGSVELNKPTSGLISSKSTELIIPEFLEQSSKTMPGESSASTLSKLSKSFKPNGQSEASDAAFSKQQLKYDEYNLHSNDAQKLYTRIQLKALPLIELKSDVISSNVGELIVPRFTKSKLMEFNKNIITEMDTTSSSREIRNTDAIASKHPAPLSIKTSEKSSSVKQKDQGPSNNRNNTSNRFSKSTSCPVQLSQSEFKPSTYSQNTSNSAEIIVPVFSESRLKQFSKTNVSKSEPGSTLKTPKSATSKTNNAFLIQTSIYTNPIADNSNSNPLCINTLEFKEPTTTILSSNNGEITVPVFSTSLVNKLIKSSKRHQVSTSNITLETDECENEVPTSSGHDSSIKNSLSFIGNFKNKDVAFEDKCSTKSINVKDPSNTEELPSKNSDATAKNDQSNPSTTSDACTTDNTKSNKLKNKPSYTINNNDSILSKSLSKSTGEAPNETIMYYPAKIELFSHSEADVLNTEKHENASGQSCEESNINIPTLSEYKAPKCPEKILSEHNKLQKETRKSVTEPGTSSLVEIDQTNPETMAPNKSEKSRSIYSNPSNTSNSLEINAVETFDSVNTEVEHQSDLKPQEKECRSTPESNAPMSTNLEEINKKKFKPDYYHEFNTSKSAEPNVTTIVQLEVSKPAELANYKLHRVDVSNYIKSKPDQTDVTLSKNPGLRQRITSKSDAPGTPRTNICLSKKKDNSRDYIIEINKLTEENNSDNGQYQGCSTSGQSNTGALHLQACDRNWKNRFRRDFPTSVYAIESFVFADARLYVSRTGHPGTHRDTDLVDSISHILHLYEDGSVNIADISIASPIMPTAVDVSIQAQLLTSENVKFDVSKDPLYRLARFKQIAESDSVNKVNKADNQGEVSETICENQCASNSSLLNDAGPSRVISTIRKNPETPTVNISEDAQETVVKSALSRNHDSLKVRKFNKAKHVQLYTPLLAKLVAFDITVNLSYLAFKKSPNSPESSTNSSTPELPDVTIDHSNPIVYKNVDYGSVETSEASSSEPLADDNITVKKHDKSKKHRTREYETIEIIVEPDVEERSYNRFQIEYIELYEESSDESSVSDTEVQTWIHKLLRKNMDKKKKK